MGGPDCACFSGDGQPYMPRSRCLWEHGRSPGCDGSPACRSGRDPLYRIPRVYAGMLWAFRKEPFPHGVSPGRDPGRLPIPADGVLGEPWSDFIGSYWDSSRKSCRLNGSSKIEEYCDIMFTPDRDLDNIELCQLSGLTDAGDLIVWNATDRPFLQKSAGGDWPRHYIFSFTIAPGHAMTPNAISRGSAYHRKGIIESLYCSLLQLLGGRCE